MVSHSAAAPSRRAQRRVEQPRSGDERERAILAAARAALKARTFDTMSISELVASAHVSRPSFYFYFASKDALLATLIEEVLAEIRSNLELANAREGADTRARIREGVGHIVAAWLSHREILCAAVELGSRLFVVEDMWRRAVIGSVELFLHRLDLEQISRDAETLRRQAHLLAWGQERNLYNLAKSGGDVAAFAALATDLTEMWFSALFGSTTVSPQPKG
ncbi:hypothetical protein ATE68_00490 [Sphingopyxis sp. H038]|uniref:TetR/AcrR family transcriptional regulator n=1 Tax=unclassified Sphingopyxis TaxID=2614943 RepID=UPI0007313E02|nr:MULTISPECIES: TetR/AcrR family transcriptional regulator [unclassified Sphingopyxis]KTE04169.1 hypothetical protein ATE78_00490 [Sphingopyxis sp. H012]KTE13628.1 hypothetical protein ATE70_02935 [Sphingopyxis sp. H053]KTE15686.1 hypothetical protein ATE76_02680 [Sphingopyxis sp. H093]KTE15843.1 hypothetical protein ATE76_03540 [Sphingopyxis sp. H093]KTE30178.1 hypothetical protein ATE75_03905 [Sphingopyxis sp. H080]